MLYTSGTTGKPRASSTPLRHLQAIVSTQYVLDIKAMTFTGVRRHRLVTVWFTACWASGAWWHIGYL